MTLPVTRSSRIVRWLRRYGPQEIVSLLAGTLLVALVRSIHDQPTAAALAYFVGDNGGCYGFALAREWRSRTGDRRGERLRKCLRAVIAEFGPAEIGDLCIRPVLLTLAAHVSGSVVAMYAGALVANLSYYGIAGVSHDLRRPATASSAAAVAAPPTASVPRRA